MYIQPALLLLATSLLPCILAHSNSQIPIDADPAVPIKQTRERTPQIAKYDEYIDTIEQEFTTHMSSHKTSMKSHLESLAEVLGVELDSIAGADLEGLLSIVVLVLGDVELDAKKTYKSAVRGGTARTRGGAGHGEVLGYADELSGGSDQERKSPNIGDRQVIAERLETFVTAMGIVSEMKEQHLALNLWLVGIREKIRELKGEGGRG